MHVTRVNLTLVIENEICHLKGDRPWSKFLFLNYKFDLLYFTLNQFGSMNIADVRHPRTMSASLINRSSVRGELGDWLDLSSSLRCRWAPLGPRIHPGWKHPVFRTRLVRESGKTLMISTSSVQKI